MKVAFFSTKSYDRTFFDEANKEYGHELVYFEPRLTQETLKLAQGFHAICIFVNDRLDADMLQQLSRSGTRMVALRSAGFNHVDLEAAQSSGITLARVPAYSPHSVAEHTVALLLGLNRKIHRAHARVREGNFSLEGLLGFDLSTRTVGVVGTGKIGLEVVKILKGFGCEILACDPFPNKECETQGAKYVSLADLFTGSDIITLHCPLTPETYHLIDAKSVAQMRNGVVLLNTSRGALVDTRAVVEALKAGRIGYLGLDVYEEEADLFFEDFSNELIQDDLFARLLTFPNVLITGHQAFFTDTALRNIANTTLANITEFEELGNCQNAVAVEKVKN